MLIQVHCFALVHEGKTIYNSYSGYSDEIAAGWIAFKILREFFPGYPDAQIVLQSVMIEPYKASNVTVFSDTGEMRVGSPGDADHSTH